MSFQISDMACTENAITTAAYNSKPTFTNVSNQTLSYSGYPKGQIAAFSSHGPTADGRVKPNITGPGLALASSVSASDSGFYSTGPDYNAVVSNCSSPLNAENYSYAMLAGTSMSGPVVSGIAALLLEADSSWNPQQIMAILAATAIRDSYTGTIPPNGSTTWGFGKVNCYAAIQEALNYSGVNHQEQSQLNCLVYPNPGNGAYTLSYTGAAAEMLTIEVMDVTGRIVQTDMWTVNAGSNTMMLDLSSLTAGTYIVRLNGGSGTSSTKVIKR
jgi:subtilisin family serine protease